MRISGSSAEKGLVHQQDVGVGRERASQSDALLHAARQLVRVFGGPAVEADHRELLVDDPIPLGARDAAQFKSQAHVVAHGPPRQQPELLEHHGDRAGAEVAQGRGIAGGDIDRATTVGNQDRAPGRRDEPVH